MDTTELESAPSGRLDGGRIVIGSAVGKTPEVIHGEAANILPAFRGTVDLIIADPPYNQGIEYDGCDDKLSPSVYEIFTDLWLNATMKALKPTGAFWVVINDDWVSTVDLLAKQVGFIRRNWVIWRYQFGQHQTRKFVPEKVHLLSYVKESLGFTFNDRAIRIKSRRQELGDKRADPGGRVPGDVWEYPRVAGTHAERVDWHPCQLPIAMLERIVKACSNPGELVVDPFCGSATTGVAAVSHGRRFVGIDQSALYVRKGQARLDRFTDQRRLLGTA